MKYFIIISILFFSFFSLTCSRRVYPDEGPNAFYLPREKPNYKLAKEKFNLTDTLFIDLKAAYCNSYPSTKHVGLFHYTFIRFLNDGRVFFSFTYSTQLKNVEFNNFSYGKFGRYLIQDNKYITIELFQDRKSGIAFMHAVKTDNGIQFFSYGSRNPKGIFNKKGTDFFGYYEEIRLPQEKTNE